MSEGTLLLIFVTLQRWGEFHWDRDNSRRLIAKGAVELARSHYPLLIIVHAGWLIGLWNSRRGNRRSGSAVDRGRERSRLLRTPAGLTMRLDMRDSLHWGAAMATALVAGWIAGRRLEADKTGATVELPARRDVLSLLTCLYTRIGEHRVTSIAGGVTFFVLLALFPATAALVSIYGLFADTSVLSGQLAAMAGVLPQGAIDIIGEQLSRLIAQQTSALGLAFLLSVALSLWSANAGMKAVFDALNIIHDEQEKRGFFALNAISLAFTLSLILFFMVAVAAIVVLPAVLSAVGIGDSTRGMLIKIARWPLLFVAIALVLSLIYRFGPSCTEARWRPISAGSAAAALGWIVASMAFSWYAANFGNFNKTYGTLGAAIGFMTWNWIVTIVMLVGAEIDAECEHKPATPLGRTQRSTCP